jgi:hypothetical protein
MASLNKHQEKGFVAVCLAQRLCPDSPTLLEFVRYGATCDKIAKRDSKDTKDFFPNFFREVLAKEGKQVNRKNLLSVAQEIVKAADGVQGIDVGYLKDYVTQILTDTLVVELKDQLTVEL